MAPGNETAQPELVITRVLDAPRALVFKAWTDPDHLAQWWGPHGFTNPVCEWDVRLGGAIRVHMRGPDGTVYPMTGVYNEIVEPERLSFVCAALDQNGNPLLEVKTTAIFEDLAGKTRLTLQARVLDVTGDGAQHLAGMKDGWGQSLERLAETVARLAGDTSDREIVITRLMGAPRELVFDAWTDVKHLHQWWGPRGFTTTTHEIAVRPGGTWRFIMHGPDGVDYPNWIVYDEIVRPERLVYSHGGGEDGGDAQFQTTVTFVEEGGKTRVTMRAVFPSAAERDHVVKVCGAVEGGNQHMDRMEEHVATMSSPREFVITRVFDAPRDLVFRAWTESEHLMNWWGPKGFTMKTCNLDLRPGGFFHYCLLFPDGKEMWGKFVYREIAKPERLIFIDSFSNEQGGVTHHPLSPTWPSEVLNTLTFTERGGQTTVTLRGVPINATDVQRKTFEEGFSSLQKGFGGTMDQLAEYLAKHSGGSQ